VERGIADPKKVRADANALAAELLKRLSAEDVQELEVKRGGLRVKVSRNGAVAAGASAPAAAVATHATAEPAKAELPSVKAPLTGVFYRSPSPQAASFVQNGSIVAQGDVIGLIEAMKLFNEIRSTMSGKVTRIFAENGQLVRAHQPLVEIEPI
jgi:acetyl-CoA carboxylase biotin carboxyl carrier protein